MKRVIVSMLLVFSAFGLIFAQSSDENGQAPTAPAKPDAVSPQTVPAGPEQTPAAAKPASASAQTKNPAPAVKPTVVPASRPDQTPVRQNPQTSFQAGNNSPTPARETIYIMPGPARRIISGVLGISRGMITLTDKNGVAWYILGLDRFIGFIDGLDLGEEVELEGYAPASPGSSQERFFQATKLILDGMDYDLAPLPEGGQVRIQVQPRKEKEPVPEQPKAWEHNHLSAWSPHYDLWMQGMDMNAIWKENPKQNKQPKKKW
ncbi:hypothetical protein AGMMS50268_02630 [Spirochaetia bacterium]|nr:hypothetical protein AGMMS50268_02630 [Spirochaetia bacterium]